MKLKLNKIMYFWIWFCVLVYF